MARIDEGGGGGGERGRAGDVKIIELPFLTNLATIDQNRFEEFDREAHRMEPTQLATFPCIILTQVSGKAFEGAIKRLATSKEKELRAAACLAKKLSQPTKL